MPTSRISIMPLGLTLSFFLVITYVLCVIYGLLGFQQGMHRSVLDLRLGLVYRSRICASV